MYQYPERPLFEDEEFVGNSLQFILSSFHPNRTEHLSCNNSSSGLIKKENLAFSRKAELSKVLIHVGTAVMGRN